MTLWKLACFWNDNGFPRVVCLRYNAYSENPPAPRPGLSFAAVEAGLSR
jgi:hypothetical protein